MLPSRTNVRSHAAPRLRVALGMTMSIAFALFVSVASASADDVAPQPAQLASPVVTSEPVPAPEPAPAPAEPAVDAPVVPAAAPVAAPEVAPQPELKPVVAPDATPTDTNAAQAEGDGETSGDELPVDKPQQQERFAVPTRLAAPVLAAAPLGTLSPNACKGNGKLCRVERVNGVWQLSAVDKVAVCHAVGGSGSTGFGFTTPSVNSDGIAVDPSQSNKHGAHTQKDFWRTAFTAGDIVETFFYVSGSDNTVREYAGANLSASGGGGTDWSTIFGVAPGLTGATIMANGCTPPNVAPPVVCSGGEIDYGQGGVLDCRPPKPVVADMSVDVCHASVVGGSDAYERLAWQIALGNVAAGHGVDADDIIPAFTYTSDYTWNAGDGVWEAQTAQFAGRNLGSVSRSVAVPGAGTVTITFVGSDVLGQGCTMPAVPPKPPVATDQVNLCHATRYVRNAPIQWASRTVDSASITAPGGHDGDAGDVIPAFSYTSDYRFDSATHSWVPVTVSYPGKNLTNRLGWENFFAGLTGTERLARTDCMTSSIPPKPIVLDKLVPVCHAVNTHNLFGYLPSAGFASSIKAGSSHGSSVSDEGFDVIAPFSYVSDYTYNAGTNSWDPIVSSYAGKNMGDFTRTMTQWVPGVGLVNTTRTLNGASMLAGNCQPPQVPARPTITPVSVPMCHAGTTLPGFDTYTTVTATEAEVLGAGGHDSDQFDVIPSFDYTTGYTYDGLTNSWKPTKVTYAGKNLGDFTRTVTLPVVGTVSWTYNGQAMLASQTCDTPQPAQRPAVTPTPVSMCHATTIGGFDSYVLATSDSDGVLGAGGHGSEAYDVIPSFTYVTDYTFDAVTNSWIEVRLPYAGTNLGSFTRTMNVPGAGVVTRVLNGADLFANGCVVPELPARPDVQPAPVTMCHATMVDGIDSYTLVNGTQDSVLGAGGHDADAFDVIPSFAYTTGHAYDHVTNSWIAQTAQYPGKNLGTFARTVNLSTGSTTMTIDGTAMLASGTCALPQQPVTGDTTPPTTNAGDVTPPAGGGDTPQPEAADGPADEQAGEQTPTPENEDEPKIEPAATVKQAAVADDGALPFTGLQLGALLLVGFGTVGAGMALHLVRRRRRESGSVAR